MKRALTNKSFSPFSTSWFTLVKSKMIQLLYTSEIEKENFLISRHTTFR